MRRWVLVAMTAVLLAGATMAGDTGRAGAFPTRPGGPLAGVDWCPVTRSNGVTPPDSSGPGRFQGDYGNETLWTNLWMWGEGTVWVDPAHRNAAGEAEDLKWAWWRFAPGQLTIEGRRLDGEADPLRAWVPEGYGAGGFQVSGLTFPTAGCWQVVGRLLDSSDPAVEIGRLTFVVRVVYVDELPWA